MELLTGKAKEDFVKHFYGEIPFRDIELNAHIIEWLDSVGLKVIIIPTMCSDVWGCDIWGFTECLLEGFETRSEATEKAILKASEIYNYLNK
jgi:hypothetical protein